MYGSTSGRGGGGVIGGSKGRKGVKSQQAGPRLKPVDNSEQTGDSIDNPKVTMSTTNAQTSLEHVQGPAPSEDIFSNMSQKANKKNAYLLTG